MNSRRCHFPLYSHVHFLGAYLRDPAWLTEFVVAYSQESSALRFAHVQSLLSTLFMSVNSVRLKASISPCSISSAAESCVDFIVVVFTASIRNQVLGSVILLQAFAHAYCKATAACRTDILLKSQDVVCDDPIFPSVRHLGSRCFSTTPIHLDHGQCLMAPPRYLLCLLLTFA
jgi:hypothetical protein